jgi:hypothetical protein
MFVGKRPTELNRTQSNPQPNPQPNPTPPPSQDELRDVRAPRVFSLTKIVEIAHFNMGRIRWAWWGGAAWLARLLGCLCFGLDLWLQHK